MRLWSLHPKYLDAQGLVALWREGLLALKVLQGKTRGYKNHPQLERFRAADQPIRMMHAYLGAVLDEARARGYRFNATKIRRPQTSTRIPISRGQLAYEFAHLKKKLWRRSRERYASVKDCTKVMPHPLFKTVPGNVASWERV